MVIHTYSSELDASTHFELYSPAHDVDPLISTNDSLAVPFDVQVRRCTAGDLQSETITHFFRLLNLSHTGMIYHLIQINQLYHQPKYPKIINSSVF